MNIPRSSVVVVLVSALIAFVAFPNLARSSEPIKIGFLAPMTGPMADLGQEMVLGTRLALKKLGSKIAGRPVELLVEDTAANPDTGLSKARRLVEHQKVDMLMGVYHGGVAMAVSAYAKEQKIPLVISGGGGATQVIYKVKPQPYVFRSSVSIRGAQLALSHYAATELGFKRAVSMSWDHVAGRDAVESFTDGFEAGGGKVLKNIHFKLGTPDFSAFFASIPKDSEIVHMFLTGADGVRFVKQFAELGYKDKFQLVADGHGISDRLLPVLGDAAVGVISSATYLTDAATPGNKEFSDAYVKETATKPGTEAAYSYASMLYVAQAIESIGGNVSDVFKLLTALKGVEISESIRGPFSFNSMNDIIFSISMTRVIKKGGATEHKILKVYPKVDALSGLGR